MEVNGISMLIIRLEEIAWSVDRGESLLQILKEFVLVVGGRQMLYLICDSCSKSKPESECSYYYDDDGFVATKCFSCQPKSLR